MTGFSNAGIKDKLNRDFTELPGFTPSVSYAYDAEAQTVTFTDATTYQSGDSRKVVQLTVRDKKGNKVVNKIAGNDNDNAQAVDVSSLDKSEGLDLAATVVTTKDQAADGSAQGVGINTVSGNLNGFASKESNVISF